MRRTFLTRMVALPALGLTSTPQQPPPKSKILINGLVQWADTVLTE
jgi:hypothetical protein